MTLLDTPIATLRGEPATVGALTGGKVALVVNVASRCGLTPQYSAMQKMHEDLSSRGFTVLGVPCNQFKEQEPGTPEEIETFCSTTYGVTFPMTEKVDVNGPARHPLYETLTATADSEGKAGDILWNFEKFVLAPDGEVLARFRPQVQPDDPAVLAVLESALPD